MAIMILSYEPPVSWFRYREIIIVLSRDPNRAMSVNAQELLHSQHTRWHSFEFYSVRAVLGRQVRLIRLFSRHVYFKCCTCTISMQKVPCTVQSLQTHEKNMAHHSVLRDFDVLISLVRGSTLASVRLFLLRLNKRGCEHGYRPIAKTCHCATTKLQVKTQQDFMQVCFLLLYIG